MTKEAPWENEPDIIDAGHMIVLRHPEMGHLCGYVQVPEHHPWYCEDYDTIHELFDVDVHGGLTYAGDGETPLKHIGRPANGQWWVGFDCAHYGDLIPKAPRPVREAQHYRDIEYVKEQCIKLATQVIQAHEGFKRIEVGE